MKLFLLLFTITRLNAAEWKRGEGDLKFTEGFINFSNRSSCARKSLEPTKSIFLLVDNVNIAKSAYRLAKLKGIDPVYTTDYAIEKFRYGIKHLVSLISSRLISGGLPLVDDNLLNETYLKNNWEKSYIPIQKDLIGCKVVKKMSSLFSYLNVSRPDHYLFEEMAKDLENMGETFSSCDNFKEKDNPEVALYQFDLRAPDDFKKYGFRFWYSLKVYLAWAYRFSPEMKTFTFPFDHLFKSADLEEMVLFISNGCESMTPTECSDHDLNLEKLSQLTVPSSTLDVTETSLGKPIVGSPVDELFSKPIPLKEDDLLNLGDFKGTDEWIKNFRDNIVKTRGYQKIRFNRALSHLNLISLSTDPDKLEKKIIKETFEENLLLKQELFYLCSEYQVAKKIKSDFFKNDVSRLALNGSLRSLFSQFSSQDIVRSLDFVLSLSSKMILICNDLEVKNYWQGFESKKDGFSPWYLEVTRGEKDFILDKDQTVKSSLERSYLRINNETVICHTGIHCARILLDSIIAISSLSKSLSTISPDGINSTNMANPYSTQVACGTYDPWAKKNRMIFEAFHDLTQTALFSLAPSPIYISADIEPKKIVSFSTLIKEGKVFYDPKFAPKKVKLSLVTDLGPLLGVPCAVSISGSRLNPLQYFSFTGISFSGCRERSRSELQVSSGDEFSSSSSFRQACAACAINLQTMSSAVSSVHPAFRFSFFLLKGILRFASNLKDPQDLAKSWKVSPQQVSLSYRYFGKISSSCGKKLLKGVSCLPSQCERNVLEDLTRKYSLSPVSTDFSCFRRRGNLKVKECNEPIYLTWHRGLEIKSDCPIKERSL